MTTRSRFRARWSGAAAALVGLAALTTAGPTPVEPGGSAPPGVPNVVAIDAAAPPREPVLPGASVSGSVPATDEVPFVVSDLKLEVRKVLFSDPGTLTGFRGRIGEMLFIRVTGDPDAGPIYGSGIYTDDSTLATATVHAGVLDPGETAVVKVMILPGQANYDAATRHGVSSHRYGQWSGSYRVERVTGNVLNALTASMAEGEVRDDPGNMTRFHLPVGATLRFRVTGSIDGFVWGNEPYTFDSDLSTAAVHAGVLQVGETSIVKVTIQPVQYSFPGTERNGVTSRDWLPWDGNYRVERDDAGDAR